MSGEKKHGFSVEARRSQRKTLSGWFPETVHCPKKDLLGPPMNADQRRSAKNRFFIGVPRRLNMFREEVASTKANPLRRSGIPPPPANCTSSAIPPASRYES
jgi:hypothetical protein